MRTARWLLLVGMLPVPLVAAPGGIAHAQDGARTNVVGSPSPAPAPASASTHTRARALELFEQSAQAYREGRFQDSIDLLMEARRVTPEPVLLYNIGRAYEALGEGSQAADAYDSYLKEDPRAPDRRAIEGRIATLRAQANQLEKARTMPPPEPRALPPEPAPPAPPPDFSPSVVPWVITGAGVAGLGAAVALALIAGSRHRAAVEEPEQATAARRQDQAESFATGATIAFVAGGAVAAIGLGWLSFRALTPGPVNVSVAAGPASLGLRGTF